MSRLENPVSSRSHGIVMTEEIGDAKIAERYLQCKDTKLIRADFENCSFAHSRRPLCLGLKVLQLGNHLKGLIQLLFDFRGKSSDLRNEFCSKSCTDHGKYKTIVSCGFRRKSSDLGNELCSKPCGLLEFLRNSESIGQLEENNGVEKRNGDYVKENFVSNGEFGEFAKGDGIVKENFDSHGEFGNESNGQELVNGDEEVDAKALRELVNIERQRADALYVELEKERNAAATASEEAMAMILRLQNEKSLIEMEAKQYRRLAEEKQIHDQEVIQSLRWIVMKHESERGLFGRPVEVF
ncbi:hypothetical protein RHSIM_Rhsim05G0100200 [Rhododendron simsii]|uniref:GTD-binding domain-containing protein n=1 Tax=Rhododendron simsii TaxID=118357 RepID=A0A834H8T7_RHOSS|nr:hypothetical protein RHSIM_Rhsim05G0100200 [Rhododendron simsii]